MDFKDTFYGDLTNKKYKDEVIVSYNNLTSLKGSPKEVDGDFHCASNQLTSLKYCPQIVNGGFNCSYNNLMTLEYSPKEINFSCEYKDEVLAKDIKEGKLKIVSHYFCNNNNLISLKGRPKKIIGVFSCCYNDLTSLEGRPKEITNDCFCQNNHLKSLEHCPKIIGGGLDITNNPELKNIKKQIIKYQIKAKLYKTDEGNFYFEDIKKEFVEETKKIKQKIKQSKEYKIDFGLSI